MELLTIIHRDFQLTIECTKFDDIFGKALRNIGADELLSTYSWSDGVERVVRHTEDGDRVMENGGKSPAIFFDNADYPIWIEFNDYVSKAQFGSMLQSENEKFSFHRKTLAGFLNYGNEIGKSEINILYKVAGETRKFTFSFEVLSTKLNYHEHWRSIIEDIEREYSMLSLDYMRRTFHGFSPDTNGETPEIVWWSVFAGEQMKFIRACKSIIERPRHRLHGQMTYKRADRLTYIPASIENEFAEYRGDSTHLYRVQEKVQTNDTQENRFLKFALSQITSKYERLKKRIDSVNNVSDIMKCNIRDTLCTLNYLRHNPFFRTVGRFKGMNQESLVMQKASGYSQVYRTWSLLRRGYSLYDGMYRLQTKDIATLYEIWCFIEVSHIVKEQLHLTEEDVDHRNRMEMNGLFTWELGRGEHSRILFRKDGVELAELIYNPQSTSKENDSVGIVDIVVPTVPQRPDIVLQLTKDDLQEGMKMTYLFDAKYRIEGRDSRGVDTPPDDAINQMHRYRDAIYYKEHSDGALKKEVIGGYILFPGNGEQADIEVAQFYKSIDEVNIGAFPLRPGDRRNRELLENFIAEKIEAKGYETIEGVIPQKGTFVEVGNRVLIGLVEDDNPLINDFKNGVAKQYYLGSHFPQTISLKNLHFFMPYIKNFGIRDIYEITNISTIPLNEARRIGNVNEKEGRESARIAFSLVYKGRLYPEYRRIDTGKMIYHSFLDTSFAEQATW